MFCCLCYVKDISTDILEDQVSEYIGLDLNKEEDLRLDAIREDYWRDVAEEGDDKKKIFALSCEVYVKEKGGLIKR